MEKKKPTLQEQYEKVIVPAMMKKFGYKNGHQVPRLVKISVNMGVGKGAEDVKVVEAAQAELSQITGQHAVITRAKKAISNFKIRENSPVGCRVTLRKRIMYEFMERLLRVALPRVRDFRGLSPRGFDQGGNYTFGLSEQNIFPEVETDRVTHPQGMDITFVIKGADTRDESYELLTLFGVPFRTKMEKVSATPKPAAEPVEAQG
ncbi:MAG TPA: 50S ribosomal protein L5 [Candidatus Eisenbacteria bacterium]|jgi:large subunit ribosomal protein L5|nr:50S ribosomal protein L5 [Candidatus Eisenbacteria bacterium]